MLSLWNVFWEWLIREQADVKEYDKELMSIFSLPESKSIS